MQGKIWLYFKNHAVNWSAVFIFAVAQKDDGRYDFYYAPGIPLCSTQPLALPATENLWSADGSYLVPLIDHEVHLYT
jgi:hypothetical protein